MKGQLSIEFLIIILVALSFFSIMVPVIASVKSLGDYSINIRAGSRLLDILNYSCRLSKIQGDNSRIDSEFFAPINYTVSTENMTLFLNFPHDNASKLLFLDNFDCKANATVQRGLNHLVMSNELLNVTFKA